MKSIGYRMAINMLKLIQMKERMAEDMKELISNGKSKVSKVPKILDPKIQVEQTQILGRNIFLLSEEEKEERGIILYLHGGCYTNGLYPPHWNYVTKLVKECNYNVIVPDYPLAPEATYQDSFSMAEILYQQIQEKYKKEQIVFMGDSAGGGFALALAQKLAQEKKEGPSKIILFSPWLDISLTNPAIKAFDKKDPFLSVEALKLAGKSYANELELTNYLVSPLYGTVQDLGKISIFIGTNDILCADTRKFKLLCDEKNVEIDYYEYPEMLHDFMLAPLKESQSVYKRVKYLLCGEE